MLKLSIVIPIYNVEKYLRACLDSVLCPEREDYEIIAVNDGSTDGSPAVCAEYAERWPGLVRTVTTPNGGLGHARNTGLELARGKYLLFLDGDDSLFENALPEMLKTTEEDFDICFFDLVSVTEGGKVLKTTPGCSREGAFRLEDYPELLFETPSACCKLWRRELFTNSGIRFPDRLWFEDMATSPLLYARADKLLSVRKSWYRYLQRAGSITNSASLSRNLEIITAVDAVLKGYKALGLYEKYLPQLEYMSFYNQLLTSSTRVNLIDRNSPVQDRLLEDFREKFPRYRENRYIREMPGKYKLLLFLIEHRQHLALNLVMRLNNRVKGK